MLTDFQGIREFGFVAGAAVLMAALSMVTLFPALLALADRGQPGLSPGVAATVAPARWLERIIQHRKTIMAATGILTVFALWGALHVDFDYNMLKLQARGVESVLWEERILAKAGRSGLTALATASSLDEFQRKRDAFAALPSVSKVESVLMLVPDHQAEKVKSGSLCRVFPPRWESPSHSHGSSSAWLRGAAARADGGAAQRVGSSSALPRWSPPRSRRVHVPAQ